jgi:hypothetical protein
MMAEQATQETVMDDLCELIIPDKSGDERITWDPNDKKSTEKARERFKELLRSGWSFFRMKTDLKTGEHIRDFDPTAKKILAVAPMCGG